MGKAVLKTWGRITATAPGGNQYSKPMTCQAVVINYDQLKFINNDKY